MSALTISFDIPPDILASLRIGAYDLGRKIRLMSAIAFFKEKRLSLGKAAQLADMNRLDFMDIMSENGVVIFDYDESALQSDLNGIDHLGNETDDHL